MRTELVTWLSLVILPLVLGLVPVWNRLQDRYDKRLEREQAEDRALKAAVHDLRERWHRLRERARWRTGEAVARLEAGRPDEARTGLVQHAEWLEGLELPPLKEDG